MSEPIDPKILTLCQKLDMCTDPTAFTKQNCYNNVQTLLSKYAPSTAEDYIWRLHRYLSKIPNFPVNILKKYKALLTHYKTMYPKRKK